MDTDGIGVDDEGSTGGTEGHEAETLLKPAEGQAQQDADDGSDGGDEAALEEEDAGDLLIAGTEVAKGDDILLLVDDEHGQGAYDVETGHHQDEGEEDIGYELLDLHDLKGIVLLFEAVFDDKTVATERLDLELGALEIAAGLQTELERGEHALLVEEPTGKGDAGDDVVLVVLGLFDVEEDTRGIEFVFLEGLGGVGHVELSLTAGGIDLQRRVVGIAGGELFCQTDARDAIVHIGSMEAELTVANQNLVDMGELVEVVVDTFDDHHRLAAVVDGQGLILDALGGHLDLGQLTDLGEDGIVGGNGLALNGGDLQLRVERGEEGGHKVVEAIEDTEGDDKGHGGDGDTYDGDAADDVDSVGRLLGEEITPGNEKRKVHYFFNSSSMRSI